MSRFPTGVTVVAAVTADGTPRGLTVNAFTSVSLDPPLVLVCIDRKASSHDPLIAAGAFCVTILASDQADVAQRFAGDPAVGRFDNVKWMMSEGGNPVLSDGAAWLDCVLERIVDAGDHSIMIGRVTASGTSEQEPLLFYGGSFGIRSECPASTACWVGFRLCSSGLQPR
ncbi:MAG: flavin reductase family protein [Gemmatimonadales bacterium]|nr:flavin reductase family protein [Gemmatimonadales bacterium]